MGTISKNICGNEYNAELERGSHTITLSSSLNFIMKVVLSKVITSKDMNLEGKERKDVHLLIS
jgi:hypothetical protein